MNLKRDPKAIAQARADKMHADLILADPLYAESVALYNPQNLEKGGTARWCFIYQDLDPVTELPKDTFWHVPVDKRVMKVLTKLEKTELGIAEVEAL